MAQNTPINQLVSCSFGR